ncbi:MAG TPA: glycosyltransferase family 2 protein [Bryobacteraceae bacterium]|nr:glycosyltransferase family 2 protein [Bryobacteraceae bacterium]HPQ13878.1 glycosyltransferase family 2 protein [Bryobacteraceae bacterium]HPU73644.1 glycosyltransferase family 2 protein [Bryobacteraceae bacterium]
MVPVLNPAFFLAVSAYEQLKRALFDNTFSGIHQLEWFDWSILIPYFGLLGILSIYGLHRYEIIRTYFKHRKKLPREAPARFEQLPPVTIQLPLYNERYVVERLIESVSKIEYPRDLLQIQVLDDSTDETHVFAERLVARYRAQGVPIEYHHRSNREGFKAGALQEGLKTATGELIAIFDADFVPPPDFLMRTVHFFTDPQVGVVQTRWSYLNREFNVLTEVQAMLLDGHFVLEHGARFGRGLFFNFNGTGGILRRKMIEDAGGWQHDTLTEDSDLSYRAQLKGWKFVYLPGLDCPSELPVEMYGFQVQQSRWAKGLTQTAKKLLPTILRANIPWRVKFEAVMHLTPNISYPMMVVVAALLLPVMIVRFYMGWFQMVFLDLPLIVASFWSISVFYVLAQRELYPHQWKRSIFLLPALLALGVGLTVINTRAVLEALLGVKTSFVRTPKYAIDGRRASAEPSTYRRKSGLLPFIEIAIGTYFLAMVLFAIDVNNFLSLPFLLLFVAGYYWAGFATLAQEYRDRLRAARARRLAVQTAGS